MIILIQAENGRCPKIDLSVNGSKIKHIIDTGTNLNIIISRDTYKSMKIMITMKIMRQRYDQRRFAENEN